MCSEWVLGMVFLLFFINSPGLKKQSVIILPSLVTLVSEVGSWSIWKKKFTCLPTRSLKEKGGEVLVTLVYTAIQTGEIEK